MFLCVPYKTTVHFLKHTSLPEYFKAGGMLSIDKVTGNLIKLDATQYLEGDCSFSPAKFSDIYQFYKHASNYSTNSVFSSSNILPVRYSDIAEIHEKFQAKFQSSLCKIQCRYISSNGIQLYLQLTLCSWTLYIRKQGYGICTITSDLYNNIFPVNSKHNV